MRIQLLCTFTQASNLPTSIGQIYSTHGVNEVGKIRCFIYTETPANMICVYSAPLSEKRLKDTISINYKRQTNTLYSINALNKLIIFLNNGVLDKSFAINWEEYQDTLLLSDNRNQCKFIKIKEFSL
jgi:ribosomal 30S subunit maturation factor RimM